MIAAIAAQMAIDPTKALPEQVQSACEYMEGAIRTAVPMQMGKGHGPINHFHHESTPRVTRYQYPQPPRS